MKTWLFFILAILGFSLTVSACSSNDTPIETENPDPTPDPDPQPGNSRSLVVYFSCTNTTKGVAEHIADITGGESYRIVPEVAYTTDDLNYNNSSSRANREQNDASARPAITGGIENLADYDIVFLGYPIWWGKAPKIIFTFLESYDFTGKTIVPFCTSGSSGIGSSDTDLHISASQAEWKAGRRFGAGSTKEEIKNWIENMNLSFTNSGLFDLSKGENGKAPTIRLSSGYDMPIVGLGTYSLLGDVCVNFSCLRSKKRFSQVRYRQYVPQRSGSWRRHPQIRRSP